MFLTLLLPILLVGFPTLYGEKPPEAVLPTDAIKPTVELSLLTSENPQAGDDIQLQCSAKPKNKKNESKPDSVHWIKGNVGVPEPGIREEGKRFIRETSVTERGVVLFTLTIKDAEETDADKYMCIVQVGKTGYFTSNEIELNIKPGKAKNSKHAESTDEEKELEEILKWKDRVEELSPEELTILASALLKEKEMKEAKEKKQAEETPKKSDQEQADESETKSGEELLKPLTTEEKNILKRKNAIEDMSEEELILLSKAMKKEKAIKKREEEEKEQEKKKQEEKEKERAKREMEKKKKEEKEEILVLSPEEKAILKRRNDIADLTDGEIRLLAKALKKERKIEKQEEIERPKKKNQRRSTKDPENDLTEEEREILKRKDEIRDMSQDELKILSKAVTKQKRMQEKKKKSAEADDSEESHKKDDDDEQMTAEELQILLRKDDVMEMSEDELKVLARAMKKQKRLEKQSTEQAVGFDDEMTEEEMNEILKKKDNIMELTQNDLNLLTRALTKERKLKEQRRKEGRAKPEDEMTEEEMREILKWQNGDLTKLTQNQLSLLGKALLKDKKMKDEKQKKANDPLEDEEIQIKDEL